MSCHELIARTEGRSTGCSKFPSFIVIKRYRVRTQSRTKRGRLVIAATNAEPRAGGCSNNQFLIERIMDLQWRESYHTRLSPILWIQACSEGMQRLRASASIRSGGSS